MTRKARPPRQESFRFRGRGGKRPGAGRKPNGAKAGVPHRPRPVLTAHRPALVTMRLCPHVRNLRTRLCLGIVKRALTGVNRRRGFAVIHYSVQGNHLHVIAEAADRERLWLGIRALAIRIAKAVNRSVGRKGRAFADRYHLHVLKTAREVRNALRYVLNNAVRHRLRSPPRSLDELDPYASGRHFDGWAEREAAHATGPPRAELPSDLRPPGCWLLRTGWRRWGLISIAEVPGPPGPAVAPA